MFSAAAALSLAGSASIPTTTWAAGARTAFNAASALNLASYCNGQDTLDDTECMGRWRNDAAAKGVDLYAPVGTWRYNGNLNPYNGMNLRCESSSAVFKNHEGARGSFIYTWPATKFQDVSIENCGFDINGTSINFASVIDISGSFLTVRGNRIFDSTQLGRMYVEWSRQRQYILLLDVTDVLIEGNQLSEGGRIKAGQPGRRMVIRDNRLENINDNAITVVDIGGSVSEDILIQRNVIINPITVGIFFGADGENKNNPAMTVRNIAIVDNSIQGDMHDCIRIYTPQITSDIEIRNNTCVKTGTASDWSAGIRLAAVTGFAQEAANITVAGNRIEDRGGASGLNMGGIWAGPSIGQGCITGNAISGRSSGDAIRVISGAGPIRMGSNVVDGRVRVDQGVSVINESGPC